VNPAVINRRSLKQQPAKCDVDVDPGLYVPQQKDPAAVREVERVLNPGNDPVPGCRGNGVGPFFFGEDCEGVNILRQTRPA